MPGGYLGVDIFFTISGFLITYILYKENLDSAFSYGNFYRRRINRILPAYFFVLSVTMVVAYIVILPYDFYKFGISAASSIFFASNFNYALRTGEYFSNSAEQWPLLHTWSLSVEEQFYIFWPIIISLIFYLCSKFRKNHNSILIPIIIFLIISTAALGTVMAADPAFAKWSYYLFITRANELLIGAVAAIIVINNKGFKLSATTSTVALIALIACLFVFNKNTLFPGASALIPCTLAALAIMPSDKNLAHRLLSTKILVSIGLISYSIYLWHWPTIAITKYISHLGGESEFLLSSATVIMIVTITLVMSIFSYYLVEKPIRRMKSSFKQSFVTIYLLPSLFLLSFSSWIIYSKGMPDRFTTNNIDPHLAFYHIDKSKCPSFVSLGCEGDSDSVNPAVARFLLVGNSHAEHYYELVSELGIALGVQVDLASAGGCSLKSSNKKCQAVKDYVYSQIMKYDGIIYAERWTTYGLGKDSTQLTSMNTFFDKLKTFGKPILVINRIYGYSLSVDKVYNYNRLFSLRSENDIKIEKNNKHAEANMLLKKYSLKHELKYLDIEGLLNNIGASIEAIDSLGRPNYLDSHHLSVYGGKWIASTLLENYEHTYLRELFFPSNDSNNDAP